MLDLLQQKEQEQEQQVQQQKMQEFILQQEILHLLSMQMKVQEKIQLLVLLQCKIKHQ
mgnify:CR=1 FL=1